MTNVSGIKDQMAAFLLAFFLGFFGGHRFYLGNIGIGILYLLTGGLLGIGTSVDMINLASMKPEVFAEKYNNGHDSQAKPMEAWTKVAAIIFIPFSFYISLRVLLSEVTFIAHDSAIAPFIYTLF